MLNTKDYKRLATALICNGQFETIPVLVDFGKGTVWSSGRWYKMLYQGTPDKQKDVVIETTSKTLRAFGTSKAIQYRGNGKIESATGKWKVEEKNQITAVWDTSPEEFKISLDAKDVTEWTRAWKKWRYYRNGVWMGMFFRVTNDRFCIASGAPSTLAVFDYKISSHVQKTWWISVQQACMLYQMARLGDKEISITFHKNSIFVESNRIKLELPSYTVNGIKIENLFKPMNMVEIEGSWIPQLLKDVRFTPCLNFLVEDGTLSINTNDTMVIVGKYFSDKKEDISVARGDIWKLLKIIDKRDKIKVGAKDGILVFDVNKYKIFFKSTRRCGHV